MSLLRPPIIDGRGERRLLLPALNTYDRRHQRPLEEALDATRAWTPGNINAAMAVVAAVALVAGLAIPALVYFERVRPWAVLMAPVLAGVAAPLAWVLLERWLGRDRYCKAYLAVGICPSCAFDVSAAPPEPDGCRICPECGGAWRVE